MATEMTIEEAQKAVDAMATALGLAETAVETAMVLAGALPAAIKDFHYAIGTHVTLMNEPLANVGTAMQKMGDAMMALSSAHHRLNAIRAHRKMPEPGLVALDGGGGGKP